MVKRTLKTAI